MASGKKSTTKRSPTTSLSDAVDDVLSSISDQGCGDMEFIDDRGLVEQRMGGAAPVEVSVLAAASQPNHTSSATSSTGGQSPRRSATAPDPPSPRRSGNSSSSAAPPSDVLLSALSSSPPSTTSSITSMSSGSSSSHHRSSSPVGGASPQPSRNSVFRQYFRGRQRRPADAPAPLAVSISNSGFASPAPGSPVVGGGSGGVTTSAGGGSPSKAMSASNGANVGNTSGGAWQRLAAWRKNKRDSMGNSNNLKTKSASAAAGGETYAISDADAGDPSLDVPNRRTMIWCVGDLVVNVSIGRKTTIPELRDCLASSAKAADFELPPSFVLAVERDRSIVLLSELFSPATLAFDIDTQFLVDGAEFRYLVLPEKFHELFEADAID